MELLVCSDSECTVYRSCHRREGSEAINNIEENAKEERDINKTGKHVLHNVVHKITNSVLRSSLKNRNNKMQIGDSVPC
jgi:hypothetical protein